LNSNHSQSVPSGRKQRVLVSVILDKSGSMSTKVQDVIGGFNLYLDELGKEPAVEYGFSLTLFDTIVEMRYKAVPLTNVAKLDDATYRPSGNTALLDAIGNTVQTASTDGFDKAIAVIMTDGEENSSREWTLQAIRELIKSKEAAGNWTSSFWEQTLTPSHRAPTSACRWRTPSATILPITGGFMPRCPGARICSQPPENGWRVRFSRETPQASRRGVTPASDRRQQATVV
jgi:hypothetical protein